MLAANIVNTNGQRTGSVCSFVHVKERFLTFFLPYCITMSELMSDDDDETVTYGQFAD